MTEKVKVKICGIRDSDTMKLCVDEGADFIGLNFSPLSVRNISPSRAASLLSVLENGVPKFLRPKVVFLFYRNSLSFVESVLGSLPYDYLQYVSDDNLVPGNASPLYGQRNSRILSYRVQKPVSDEALSSLDSDLLILDSYVTGAGGGTGESFPWEYVRGVKRPFFLAGGLKPETVARAVREISPFGVDVASGVESSPGIKDRNSIVSFIRNAKQAHVD